MLVMAEPTLPQRLVGYALPSFLITASIACMLQVVITAPTLVFTDFQAFRERAFSKLWNILGPMFAKDVPKAWEPLLARSRGVILDCGPGAGHQLFRFSHPENITAIYAAEPGVSMHAILQENAAKAGLGTKYHVLSCGVEQDSLIPALSKAGLLPKDSDAVFDEIVCCRVLCGVPRPTETINGLYRLLKPGGRFVVLEHVANDEHQGGSKVAMFLQQMYMALGWSFWLGSCNLTRDTTGVILKAAEKDGGWADVKLDKVDQWSVVPHVAGVFIKRT